MFGRSRPGRGKAISRAQQWEAVEPPTSSLKIGVAKPPRLDDLIGAAAYKAQRVFVHDGVFDRAQGNMLRIKEEAEEVGTFKEAEPPRNIRVQPADA
jgi:hypothetical protein